MNIASCTKRAAVIAAVGLMPLVGAGIARAESQTNGQYTVSVTHSGHLVSDVGSTAKCATNSTGHHEFYVNGQLRATTATGSLPGGGQSVAVWHANQNFYGSNAFHNNWFVSSGCTPSGNTNLIINFG
ncbi:MAG: hypothetical protein ABIR32_22915 [Ilumatobacteraceae bacterium]